MKSFKKHEFVSSKCFGFFWPGKKAPLLANLTSFNCREQCLIKESVTITHPFNEPYTVHISKCTVGSYIYYSSLQGA